MPALDVQRIERASGWRVVHRVHTTSTNDDAARLRAEGAGARTLVVADEQSAGRGREGRRFASPPGGLYASLLLGCDAGDLPGPLVAAVALAAAEALEQVTGCRTDIKWPNDLWIRGRKVGGILLEAVAGPRTLVVAGIGVNVEAVPADLPEGVRAGLTALAFETPRPVAREPLLIALLAALESRLAGLSTAAGRTALAEAYAARQALRGEAITWVEGGRPRTGRLLSAGLEGLEVEEPGGARRRLRGEHVQEVRPLPFAPPVPPATS